MFPDVQRRKTAFMLSAPTTFNNLQKQIKRNMFNVLYAVILGQKGSPSFGTKDGGCDKS